MSQPTLRIWSQGQAVKNLQQILNQVLTFLPPPLVEDGIFGVKTLGRVREFQQRAALKVDGVVGAQTWNTLEMVLAGTLTLLGQALASGAQLIDESPLRNAIAKNAHDEWQNYGATVHAKNSGGPAPPAAGSTKPRRYRQGYPRLLRYFRTSAPDPQKPGSTYFHDDAVIYLAHPGSLTPLPHWCGIFALWAIKSALVPVGNWKMGGGIGVVAGFGVTKTPRRGDVAVLEHPFQHHAVVHTVYEDQQGATRVITIDGNSGTTSTITRNDNSLKHWSHYFTVNFLP